MLFKIVGSIMVIAASSFLGYYFSRDSSMRPQQLRVLQNMLQMFENEISFLSNLLIDAFNRVSQSTNSEVSVFFRETVEGLKGGKSLNAAEAWEEAVRDNLTRTALIKEDADVLVSFGKMLGNSDLEGQIKNIRLTITQLKLQEQKAEDSRKKNEAMFKSLGVLGGIALVIILI